jgi:hypothetical protein
MHIHVCTCIHASHMYIDGKMRPVETIPGMGGRQEKGES